MQNLFETILEQAQNGALVQVDFKKRTLRVNNSPVALNENELGLRKYDDLDEWLDELENLYDEYKYSVPTTRSMKRERKSKFRALSETQLAEELGKSALDSPVSRDYAQAKLEVFVLFSLLNGSFKVDELFAKDWFFQGADKSLVMIKNWF